MSAPGTPPVPSLRTVPTADLSTDELAEARALLVAAFDGRFGESDWQHALGGLHVLALRDGRLVGHAAVVGRRLLHGGRALRCGYVEAVATAAEARGTGVGWALMAEVERLLAGSEVGALGASEVGRGLYRARGWLPWRGELAALTPDGTVRTPAERGTVHVWPGSVPLDLDAPLTCDYRDGDPW